MTKYNIWLFKSCIRRQRIYAVKRFGNIFRKNKNLLYKNKKILKKWLKWLTLFNLFLLSVLIDNGRSYSPLARNTFVPPPHRGNFADLVFLEVRYIRNILSHVCTFLVALWIYAFCLFTNFQIWLNVSVWIVRALVTIKKEKTYFNTYGILRLIFIVYKIHISRKTYKRKL